MSATTTDPSGTSTDLSAAHLSPDVLRFVLHDRFGITAASIIPLGGEVDQNSRVEDTDGRLLFVRVTRTKADSAVVQWQNSLLEHLVDTAPQLPVPRLVRTLKGELGTAILDEDVSYTVRVMTWVPGKVLAEIENHPQRLMRELGATAGTLSAALASMARPDDLTSHDWDMRRARPILEQSLDAVVDQRHLDAVQTLLSWYDSAEPQLASLPQSVVHHDLNDANVLADIDALGELRISGVVDVGDALYSVRVAEVAIAAAYAMVRKPDPLAAAAEVVAGFHSVLPLTADELSVVYPLAAIRLCMNAVTWSKRVGESGSPYGRTRMRHTWPTIEKLAMVPPEVAEVMIRQACELPPSAREIALNDAVAAIRGHCVVDGTITQIDVHPASDLYDGIDWNDATQIADRVSPLLAQTSALATTHLSASLLRGGRRLPGEDEPCTVQVGVGLHALPGTGVRAPLAGRITSIAAAGQPMVIEHGGGPTTFFSCWWGVSSELVAGEAIDAGALVGSFGDDGASLHGGVQVQIFRTPELAGRAPRFVAPRERRLWERISPDPDSLLGLDLGPTDRPDVEDVVTVRTRHIARSQRNYYRRPMNLVRGRDVWFHDEDGLAYLDSLNNVTHVGHANARVNAAAARQMSKLNTNSRFVYPQIASYAKKLVATLPAPLEVVFLVCSGSEANDLALRIARQVTGRDHIVNIDGAYHGNTGVVTGISPNRYKGPGGAGAPATTHEVRMPDRYRGPFGYDDPQAGHKYARDATSVIERISADGRRPAAFIAESLMGSGGNIVFPPGYLDGVFRSARAAGALCISDEVQVGVGRLGPWWGFELQGVVPDIVTMGKPLGNGHPLAALVTTREIADAFDTGMKYFNTFGGNPVSCAIGEEVLNVINDEGLRENAIEVGTYFAESLRDLQQGQPLIGDIRAEGLYLGIELVRDQLTREPATAEAFAVTELMKERGMIAFPNGVHDNVLKIKPPMTFKRRHVDLYVEALRDVLELPELRLPTPTDRSALT